MVHDGWSFGVFLKELTILYKAFYEGKSSPLDPNKFQFADFSQWQRSWIGKVEKEQLGYWRKKLEGCSGILNLPFDKPRPSQPTFNGTSIRFELPIETSKTIRELSRKTGTTLFMTMLTAFNILLHRYTGQEDLLVCI